MNFPYSIFKTTSGYHSIAFLIAFFVGSPYPDKITSIFFCVSFFSLHGSIYNIFPTALTRYHVSSRYTKPLIRNVSTKSIFRKWESVSNFISSWMCRRYFRKGKENRTHQIHVFAAESDADIRRHLAVRDYLRAFQETAREYGLLKKNSQKNILRILKGTATENSRSLKNWKKRPFPGIRTINKQAA